MTIDAAEVDIMKIRNPKELPKICSLLNEFLGENMHEVSYLTPFVTKPDEAIILGAYCAGELIGASYAVRLHEGMEEETAPFEWPSQEDIASDLFVLLVSSAIIPGFRGKGIGKHMAQERIRWATETDAAVACAICWESGEERTSRPLFLRLGFNEVERQESGVWAGLSCPKCGDDCKCAGVMVGRALG